MVNVKPCLLLPAPQNNKQQRRKQHEDLSDVPLNEQRNDLNCVCRHRKDKFGCGQNIILPNEDYQVLMRNLLTYRDMKDKKEKEIRQLRNDWAKSQEQKNNFFVRFDLVSKERNYYQNRVKQLKSENSSLKRELSHLKGIVKQMGVFMEKEQELYKRKRTVSEGLERGCRAFRKIKAI